MRVAIGDVRPGVCFLKQGAKPQVVRVLAVRDGVVRFEARAPEKRRAWSHQNDITMPDFLAGLVREVGSDFDPALGRAGPT